MKYVVLAFAAVCAAQISFAQDLYQPRDVKEAYKKGTRSMDGNPGSNYWENHARYTIDVTAMPPDRTVKGKESIVYFNNSPDTLRSTVMKLFLNIHKPGAARDRGATPDYLSKGMTVNSVSVNGKTQAWREPPYASTWATLRLPAPLMPHDSVKIDFDWQYEISLESGREGMIDSTTYFLAYFYPRIAVYDDYLGWDRMDFVDGKEFYSDFNDYTVTLHVPQNYVVWGTGTLQHPETVLQPSILKRYMDAQTSDATVNIITQANVDAKDVTTANPQNAWTFTSSNIPDVAFGISDHFVWDGCSVVVDDASNRRAAAYAVYNDTAKDYHYVAQYAKHSLDWLSHNWPGVPYPYEKTTVFHGYAGMEYPMMANDETYDDTLFSRFVAEHEIAHTYMPFYMGINETRYGFMDEGWATTYEYLIGSVDLGKERATQFYKQFRVSRWVFDKNAEEDIPIITPGNNLTGPGLGNNEYGKASLGYLAMKDYLGDDMFKTCLHAYMSRWNGKHPNPWDFFYTFNNVSGKNLNWFWNAWYFQPNYIDISVKSVQQNSKGLTLQLQNIGGMPAPVDVHVTYADGSTDVIHETPFIWEKNLQQSTVTIGTKKKVTSLKLDGGIFMDADMSNNSWSNK